MLNMNFVFYHDFYIKTNMCAVFFVYKTSGFQNIQHLTEKFLR